MTEGERTLLDGLRRATLDPFADPVFVFGTIRLSRATARAMEAQLARLKVAERRAERLAACGSVIALGRELGRQASADLAALAEGQQGRPPARSGHAAQRSASSEDAPTEVGA